MSTILIVEDHDLLRAALARYFTLTGHSVLAVSSVAESLSMLDHSPDAVLIDLMLPDGRGEEIAAAVRERSLPTRVIFVTASADQSRIAALAPAVVFLKPVSFEELNRAIGTPAKPAKS